MTELIYNKVAKNIKGSAFMPLLWLAVTWVLLTTIAMNIEDYSTSLAGYRAYPTTKVWPVVVYFVASLPQAIQILTSYIIVGLVKTTHAERTFYGFDLVKLAVLVWFLAYVIDVGWDYTAKSAAFITADNTINIFGLHIYKQALFESAIIYGFLSEALGSIVAGLWIALINEGAVQELVGVGYQIGDAVGSIVSLVVSFVKAILGGFTNGLKAKTERGGSGNNNPPVTPTNQPRRPNQPRRS